MSSCTQLASGMHNAKVLHDDIDELMADDDDQRQVERVTTRTVSTFEIEIPCPEAGEEMDVGGPSSVQPQSVHRIRFESTDDDLQVKRVRFAEERG